MTLQERYDVAKKYVKEHAPQIITTTAVITLAIVVAKAQRDLHQGAKALSGIDAHFKHEAWVYDNSSRDIGRAVAEGREFDYYPHLGVHVHAKKEEAEAS